MFYEFHITTPRNTLESNPQLTELTLDLGVVTFVEMQFPRGCVGLLHAQVYNELHQVWPANPDGDIASEDARLAWTEEYELFTPAKRLIVRTWNEDDSYSHTLYLRIALLERHRWEARRRAEAALAYLADWFDTQPLIAAAEG